MTTAIHISNLSFQYPSLTLDGSPVQALQGLDLDIERGEFVALMGPVGAGKTTLCLTLNGAIPHLVSGQFKGQVTVLDQNTQHVSMGQLVSQVGLVLENAEAQLFNATVVDEVAFGLESLGLGPTEIQTRVDKALELVQLAGLQDRSPRMLSGGEQKRLALASVIAMKPRILVLDEPTSGLDARGRYEILSAIDRLRQEHGAEMTVVMASQDAEAIAHFADRVIVLVEGQVSIAGRPIDVFGRVRELEQWGIAVPQLARLARRLDLPTALAPHQALQRWGSRIDLTTLRCKPSDPVPQAESDADPIVEVQRVCYSYPQSNDVALDGISLDVRRGEWLSVIGVNGSGKSTLIKHLNGILRPQSGSVRLVGQDTRQRQVGEMAHHIAYLPQNPDQAIFCATVRQEVAYGPRQLGMRGSALEKCVDEALQITDLNEIAHLPPAVLGYGLRRQVALASILAMRTPILGLDEPFNGLDRRLAQQLQSILSQRHLEGATVIAINHDLEQVATSAQRVVAMRDGRIAAQGSPRQILADIALIRKLGLEPLPVTLFAQLIGCRPPLPLTVDDWRIGD